MARQESYGKRRIGKKPPPRKVVKVHISEKEGSKHVQSIAFSIYGPDYGEVVREVEAFLRNKYDEPV